MAQARSSSHLIPLGGNSHVMGGSQRTENPPLSPSGISVVTSNGGTPGTNRTRSKLSELNAKICDMDVELVNQTRTRQSKQVAIDTVQAEVSAYTKAHKRVQSSLTDLEDRLQRLENALGSERATREVVSKNLQTTLEERVAKLVVLLEQEEDRHTSDMELMRAKVKQLEQRNKQLEMQLIEQDKQFGFVRDTQLPKLSSHINTLLRVTEQEKIKGGGGGGGGTGVPKKFHTQLQNMQNDLTAERLARERDNDVHKKNISVRMAELESQLQLEKKEREHVQERVIQPVWEELKKIRAEFEREQRDREESVSTQSQSVLDKLNIVKSGLEKATISIEQQQNTRLRELDDRLWKLSYSLEQETKDRQATFGDISETLLMEKRQREDNEEEVFHVIEQLSTKLRDGMELE